MARVSSSTLLEILGYNYRTYSEEEVKPERIDLTFGDLAPSLKSYPGKPSEIADMRLYSHQAEAHKALDEGKNVILISGTGSGKTEAWFFYAAKGKRALAIYPTLALANDQIRRLEEYSKALDISSQVIDARRRTILIKELGRSGLRTKISSVDLLITNPAFLMTDLKRMATKGSYLSDFIRGMDLLVVDELDFYGPRELALIISMMRILSLLVERSPQFVILTATLGNPDELAECLTSINGRETVIIRGKPFRVRNEVYLVLGKNMKRIWEVVQRHRDELLSLPIGEDLREAITDYERFEKDVYRVVELLRSVGVEVPQPEIDPAEVIYHYAEDDGVTLVFTRGIRSAESLKRRLKTEFGLENVASHHHLVSKEEREEIEEAARRGGVKVLISPRTLSQGLDIGTVVRVVHLGMPESVREFKQREGRKGRREELGWTETVIFPMYRWDKELLLRGVEAVEQWLQLPLEVALVNPKNKYSILFEGLYKFVHPRLRDQLDQEEIDLLKELGLISPSGLTQRGKRVWDNLNFYEFGPPYGFKRALREDGSLRYLEDIGHCDLVERFQPGSIDYSNDSVVVDFLRRGRVITGIVEEPLNYSTIYSFDPLAFAIEEYERTKMGWGERADLIDDYYRGRVGSEVVCVVDPPTDGFGLKTKIPNRVYWRVTSSKVRPVPLDGKTLFIRESRSLPVIGPTGGVYRDYTYGLSIELDPGEDLTWLRIGLATLVLVMRVSRGIPIDAIAYEVTNIGDKKIMLLYEPESAGLLEQLDWSTVLKDVENFRPDDLSEVLMMLIDDQAHYELVVSGLRWDLAKKFAKRAVSYLLLKQRIPVILEGREFFVPKPSRAHKILTMDAVVMPLSDAVTLGVIAAFDGEDVGIQTIAKEFFEGQSYDLSGLEKAVNEGFVLVCWDFASLTRDLTMLGQKTLVYVLQGLRSEGKVVELRPLVEDFLGVSPVSLEEVAKRMWGIKRSLKDALVEIKRSVSKIEERSEADWRRYTKYLREKAREIVEDRVRSLYLTYLALSGQ